MKALKTAIRVVTLGLVDLRNFKEKNDSYRKSRNKRIAKLQAERPANYRSRIMESPPQAQNFNNLSERTAKRDSDRTMDSQLRGEMAGQKNKGPEQKKVPFTFG